MKMGPVWRQDIKIHDLAFGINTEVSTSINFEIEFRKIVDKSRFNWCGGESTVKLGSEEFLFLWIFRAKKNLQMDLIQRPGLLFILMQILLNLRKL